MSGIREVSICLASPKYQTSISFSRSSGSESPIAGSPFVHCYQNRRLQILYTGTLYFQYLHIHLQFESLLQSLYLRSVGKHQIIRKQNKFGPRIGILRVKYHLHLYLDLSERRPSNPPKLLFLTIRKTITITII